MIGVGVIADGGTTVRVDPAEETDSLFEVGSIGKTMTALALATLVLDETVRLDDKIGKWLDAGPNSDITLEQLARHTAGLPRLAPNADAEPFDLGDPYASFGPEQAEEGLRVAERKDVGTELYSNFGFQLLGLALCRATGMEFAELLTERVWGPLGMPSASVTGDRGPLVDGYDGRKQVPYWHEPLPGPGAVAATTVDMTRYMAAHLDPPEGAVGDATRFVVDHGLTWVKAPDGILWHNGGTGGFCSMLVVNRDARRGVVALANSSALREIDDAAAHAARDKDPREARPVPVGSEFDEDIQLVTDRFVSADWDAVLAMMTEDFAAVVTTEMLDNAWRDTTQARGALSDTNITRVHRVHGVVRAEVDLAFAEGEGQLLVVLDDERRVAGLRIT